MYSVLPLYGGLYGGIRGGVLSCRIWGNHLCGRGQGYIRRSDCCFRKKATKYVRQSDINWWGCAVKRQSDTILARDLCAMAAAPASAPTCAGVGGTVILNGCGLSPMRIPYTPKGAYFSKNIQKKSGTSRHGGAPARVCTHPGPIPFQ